MGINNGHVIRLPNKVVTKYRYRVGEDRFSDMMHFRPWKYGEKFIFKPLFYFSKLKES